MLSGPGLPVVNRLRRKFRNAVSLEEITGTSASLIPREICQHYRINGKIIALIAVPPSTRVIKITDVKMVRLQNYKTATGVAA